MMTRAMITSAKDEEKRGAIFEANRVSGCNGPANESRNHARGKAESSIILESVVSIGGQGRPGFSSKAKEEYASGDLSTEKFRMSARDCRARLKRFARVERQASLTISLSRQEIGEGRTLSYRGESRRRNGGDTLDVS